MKNLEPIQTRGYFWLPNNPEEKLPGELRISEYGQIELDLMGIFSRENRQGGIEYLAGQLTDIDRICGNIYENGYVTLLKCIQTRFQSNLFSSQALELSSFLATIALVGVDYEQDELTFNRFNFVVEGLDDWLNFDTIRTSVDFEVDDDIIKSVKSGRADYNFQESPSYTLNDGIEVQFCAPVLSSAIFPHRPLSFFSLTSQPYISLTSQEPKKIDYFIDLADKVRKFISLAVDQEIQMQSFTFLDELQGRTVDVRMYLQMRLAREAEYKPSVQKVLFTYWDVETRFEEIMNCWITQYESDKAGHALNLYFAGAWRESSLLDTNLTFLAQAIEVLHRETNPDDRPMDQQQFREIKRKIFDLLPADIPPLIKTRIGQVNQPSLRNRAKAMMMPFENWFRDDEASDEFARRVSDTRNYFTHYSGELSIGLREGGELFDLYTKLEILLLLHILELVGFDRCQIAQMITESQRLGKALDTSTKECGNGNQSLT